MQSARKARENASESLKNDKKKKTEEEEYIRGEVNLAVRVLNQRPTIPHGSPIPLERVHGIPYSPSDLTLGVTVCESIRESLGVETEGFGESSYFCSYDPGIRNSARLRRVGLHEDVCLNCL